MGPRTGPGRAADSGAVDLPENRSLLDRLCGRPAASASSLKRGSRLSRVVACRSHRRWDSHGWSWFCQEDVSSALSVERNHYRWRGDRGSKPPAWGLSAYRKREWWAHASPHQIPHSTVGRKSRLKLRLFICRQSGHNSHLGIMSFYDHNVGLRRPPADVVEGRVFSRADVPPCRFGAVELQDHEALLHPVALDCLNVAGAHEDSSAMRGDGRGKLAWRSRRTPRCR